jgi:hypothetical protein
MRLKKAAMKQRFRLVMQVGQMAVMAVPYRQRVGRRMVVLTFSQ